MATVVCHDWSAAQARERRVAEASDAAFRRSPAYAHAVASARGMAPPDPNSPFMRKMKAAVIEHEVAKRESSRRAEFDEGELRPYNRAVDYYAVLGLEPLC